MSQLAYNVPMKFARAFLTLLFCLLSAAAPLSQARELILSSTHAPLARSSTSGSTEVMVQSRSRSGGGFGGGGGSSRSAPSSRSSGGGSFGGGSSSRSGGGFNSGSRGGGFSIPPVIVLPGGGGYNSGYNSGYRSSSSDDGGFVGLLVLLVFVFVIGFVLLSLWKAFAKRGAGAAGLNSSTRAMYVQLMLAEGDEVKRDLQDIASEGDSSSNEGLATMMQNAVLSLLRHPDRWMYGAIEEQKGEGSATENAVIRWATEARSKFSDQTTSNYSGKRDMDKPREATEKGGLYLVVTLMGASFNWPSLPDAAINTKRMRDALMQLSSLNAEDLIRIDVVWSPDQEGEFLSSDEALELYPSLTKL